VPTWYWSAVFFRFSWIGNNYRERLIEEMNAASPKGQKVARRVPRSLPPHVRMISSKAPAPDQSSLSDQQRELVMLLREARSVNDLVQLTGLDVGVVQRELFKLQIEKFVRKVGVGGYYMAVVSLRE
jgi:predicted Rossmann fold nucleotide-binding protein DprA/Smf involved in DNA uptake